VRIPEIVAQKTRKICLLLTLYGEADEEEGAQEDENTVKPRGRTECPEVRGSQDAVIIGGNRGRKKIAKKKKGRIKDRLMQSVVGGGGWGFGVVLHLSRTREREATDRVKTR